MSISLRIQGATFDKYFDMDPSAAPFIDQARAFYLFGGDATQSLKNRVPNSPNPTATAIGTPVYGQGYVRLTCAETNGISGGFNFSSQLHTHVIISAKQSTSNRILAGYWKQSTSKNEASIGWGAAFNSINSYMDGNSVAAYLVAPPVGQFNFMATTYDGTNATAYFHNGTALQSTSAAYTAGGIDTAAPFLVGASGVGAGEFDVAAIMTFNSSLNSTNLNTLYTYFKQMMAKRGIALV